MSRRSQRAPPRSRLEKEEERGRWRGSGSVSRLLISLSGHIKESRVCRRILILESQPRSQWERSGIFGGRWVPTHRRYRFPVPLRPHFFSLTQLFQRLDCSSLYTWILKLRLEEEVGQELERIEIPTFSPTLLQSTIIGNVFISFNSIPLNVLSIKPLNVNQSSNTKV